MKLTPEASSLVHQLANLPNQTQRLSQMLACLSRLQTQDKDNQTLYQLLAQQNRLLLARLAWLQTAWQASCPNSPHSPNSPDWLRLELQTLNQLVMIHHRLTHWLEHGEDDSDAGPDLNLTPPKAPKPPAPSQNSNASPAPALDFN
jgi:hypothetical protein